MEEVISISPVTSVTSETPGTPGTPPEIPLTTETIETSVTSPSVKDDLDEELQELYKVVSAKIRLSVANQKLSPESFQTILLKVVDTIEEFSSTKLQKLTGTEKRAIAMNLTRLIIDDLHANGQIDDETYGWMALGLTFLAPIIFDAAKSAWKKLQEVVNDIDEHGTTGCCKRNFFTTKTKSRK